MRSSIILVVQKVSNGMTKFFFSDKKIFQNNRRLSIVCVLGIKQNRWNLFLSVFDVLNIHMLGWKICWTTSLDTHHTYFKAAGHKMLTTVALRLNSLCWVRKKAVKYETYRNVKTKWERAAVKVNLWLASQWNVVLK